MKFKPMLLVLGIVLLLMGSCSDGTGLGITYLNTSEEVTKDNIMSVTNMAATSGQVTFSYSQVANAIPFNGRPSLDMIHSAPGLKLRKGWEAATKFSANPPPRTPDIADSSLKNLLAAPPYALGDLRTPAFQVQNENTNQFVELPSRLRDNAGTHCNIWIAEDVYNSDFSTTWEWDTRAVNLRKKFEEIYGYATYLLGFENPIGLDGDSKIQILVFDIDHYMTLEGVLGFYWPKDEYSQTQLDKEGLSYLKTNATKIFYINSNYLVSHEQTIYSTLIHEFQHMINFYQKTLRSDRNLVSAAWYNEMLAMLAEDVIGPLVGIPAGLDGHPIADRIPLFLDCYDLTGVDQWLDGENVIFSYSNVYAFGAYLVRNFGGPELINKMLFNNAVNHKSVTEAIKALNSDNYSFDHALEHYAEAILYSTSVGGIIGRYSFDKTKTWPTNVSGKNYVAQNFDIYKIPSYLGNVGAWINPYEDYIAQPHSVSLQGAIFSGKRKMTATYPSTIDIKLKVYN